MKKFAVTMGLLAFLTVATGCFHQATSDAETTTEESAMETTTEAGQ